MKIAIVLNTSWNIFNFRKGLILDLKRQGHEIVAIAPKDEYSEKLIKLGCTFIQLKMDSRGANPFKDFGLFLELLWIYWKCSPDLIFHFTVKPNIFGTIAAAILRIPSIANVCGLGTVFLHSGFASQMAKTLYKIAFLFPSWVLFQNRDDKELFVTKKLVLEDKCQLVPGSGIDLNHFKPHPKKDAGEIQFLLISRIIIDKGIQEFVKAAFILRQRGYKVQFSILGQLDPDHKRGISKAQLQEWLDWSQVKYLGFDKDVRPYLAECDAVVLPSYREGIPRSLLEAAASAKPIICTNVPGCNQVVTPGKNGYMCREKDGGDLARAMERLCLLSPVERLQMGKNSRIIAEAKFSETKVISIYSNIINGLKSKITENVCTTIQSA